MKVASALAFIHGIGTVNADLMTKNLVLCSKIFSNGTMKIMFLHQLQKTCACNAASDSGEEIPPGLSLAAFSNK
jgi:hypothetical protein